MGLSALNSTLKDQPKEYFRAENLNNDTLAVPATKVVRGMAQPGGNNHVITDGSVFDVAVGQAALLIENGKVHDFVLADTEKTSGQYRYDSDLEPSLLAGGFSELGNVWNTVKERFTFGGQSKNTMDLVYINLKEITQNPVGVGKLPFIDSYLNTRLLLGAHGYYTFRITNPIAFYENLVMDVQHKYRKDEITPQLKAEMMPKIQYAISSIAPQCVNGYQDIYLHDAQIAQILNEQLKEEWVDGRGISLVKVALSPELSPQDEKRVMELENARTLSNPSMAMGSMVNAQNQAMQSAGANANGAINGFMGMNMAQNASPVADMVAASMQQTASAQPAAAEQTWICPTCGAQCSGQFCAQCGTRKPQQAFCPNCGAKVEAGARFCSHCGTKLA